MPVPCRQSVTSKSPRHLTGPTIGEPSIPSSSEPHGPADSSMFNLVLSRLARLLPSLPLRSSPSDSEMVPVVATSALRRFRSSGHARRSSLGDSLVFFFSFPQ